MRGVKESGWKRASAALISVVWIGALFLCSAECLWHRCRSHSEGSHAHHADSHSPAAHSHNGNEHDRSPPEETPNESGFCSSLDSILVTESPKITFKPELALAWVHPFALNVGHTEVAKSTSIRQKRRADFVLTPVVCTDAATRIHAPPFILAS